MRAKAGFFSVLAVLAWTGCTEIADKPEECEVGTSRPCVCTAGQAIESQFCGRDSDGAPVWLECQCNGGGGDADVTDSVSDTPTVDVPAETIDDGNGPDLTPDTPVSDAADTTVADSAAGDADATPPSDASDAGVDDGSAMDADTVPDGSTSDPETLWSEMLALDGMHWVYRARDAYLDLDHTMPVASGDAPLSFKAIGNAVPTISDLDWTAAIDYTTLQLWYAALGPRPVYIDRGNGDEYIRFINGRPSNYQTEPGQLNPAEALAEDFHMVHCFRSMPGAGYEAPIEGLRWKDRSGNGSQIQLLMPPDPEAFGTDGEVTAMGQDNIVEIRIWANGNAQLWLNGVIVIDASFPTWPSNGLKEFTLGTGSHVMANHFRAVMFKRGAHFTAAELDVIYANTNALWPREQWPNFPYLDGQYVNNGSTWDSGGKAWVPPVGTFSGGNGQEGSHTYQWYYFKTGDSAFLTSNVLDSHLPIPGATAATLTRADYEAGNALGNPVVFDAPGDGSVRVMRVSTPYDSSGAVGESLAGQWVYDNIP